MNGVSKFYSFSNLPTRLSNSSILRSKKMNIPPPTQKEVQYYLKKWDTLENYVSQERSLKKLFSETYPDNTELDDVLIKVCALNDFYSTNIFSPFSVAKHIIALQIDKNLDANDLEIVNQIGLVEVKKGIFKNFYSFATKYCSHHKPTIYPIYVSSPSKTRPETNSSRLKFFAYSSAKVLSLYSPFVARDFCISRSRYTSSCSEVISPLR